MPIPSRLREPIKAALRGDVAEWPSPLTDQEVLALIEHGVAPLLYRASRAPELRDEAIRAATIEPLRADDLHEVLAALASCGVDALLLKGGALAYQVYAAPDLRPRSDCDLLIAETSIGAARDALRALQFQEIVTSGDEHGVRQAMFVRVDSFGVQHAYDVHWAVANTPIFASVMQFEALHARAVPLPQLGPHAHALAPPDALLLACIHRVAHHHDSDRLIWLIDIALLREGMTADEHAVFWRQAADGRVVKVCSRSIEVADEWRSRRRHDLAEDWLSPDEIARHEPSQAFLDRNITHGKVLLAGLRALPWCARMERLWQLAFPPAAFMQHSFRTRSRALLPWLYVYRGARGILRLFRRAA